MCGRYTLATAEDFAELADVVNEVQRDLTAQKSVLQGDVYPTNLAPIVVAENHLILPRLTIWGYPGFQGKSVIINARAETAPEKPMFRGALATGRCVVPSTGFYEWDKRDKQKYRFRLADTPVLYMAGLVREFEGQCRFVILTTAANRSMESIHDRMPVVLARQDVKPWLADSSATSDFLQRIPPEIVKEVV